MEWFYAQGSERRGPVAETDLKQLAQSGVVQRDTLVWNASMSDWQRAATTTLFDAETGPAGRGEPDALRCIITGKTFPRSQMIETEHGWVSAEGKELYHASLREGAPVPLAPGISNARADGKYIVVPATGARLPQRCVKTNNAVGDEDVEAKTLYWCSPYIYFALLANILILIILYFVFRKKISVEIPLSREGARIVRNHAIKAWALVIGGFVLFGYGMSQVFDQNGGLGGILAVLGIVVLLLGVVGGARRAVGLRVAKLRDGHAWLAGACPAFVASLPRYS
jgi:hypothetical protein